MTAKRSILALIAAVCIVGCQCGSGIDGSARGRISGSLRRLRAFSRTRASKKGNDRVRPWLRFRGHAVKVGNFTYSGFPNEQDNLSRLQIPTESLARNVRHYELVGGVNAHLRLINGGSRCVDEWGKEPPRYDLSGLISLQHCHELAERQNGSLGFRWGKHYVNYNVYHEYVKAYDGTRLVNLSSIFDDDSDFTCAIYMTRDPESGFPYEFDVGNLTGYTPMYFGGAGESLCNQRWSLKSFFYLFPNEMWLCYMPTGAWDDCLEKGKVRNSQGWWYAAMFVVFTFVLGYVMRDLPEFQKPLCWFVRFMLCCELGILSCSLLVRTGEDGGLFSIIVIGMTSFLEYVVMVPYRLSQSYLKQSSFHSFYLLVLAFTPSMYPHFMTYDPAFPMLVSRWPCFLGMLSFVLDVVAEYVRVYHINVPLDPQSTLNITSGPYALMTKIMPDASADGPPQAETHHTLIDPHLSEEEFSTKEPDVK